MAGEKPRSLMEHAMMEVTVPGTTWVVPFAVGGIIIGGIIWVIAYNIQKKQGIV